MGIKVYHESGAVADCALEQLAIMEAAGWTQTPPQQPIVKEEPDNDDDEDE